MISLMQDYKKHPSTGIAVVVGARQIPKSLKNQGVGDARISNSLIL
jgi:hypothetical protein